MRLRVYDHHCRIETFDESGVHEVWTTMDKITSLDDTGIPGKWLWVVEEMPGKWIEIFTKDIELPAKYSKPGVYNISATLRCRRFDQKYEPTKKFLVLKEN